MLEKRVDKFSVFVIGKLLTIKKNLQFHFPRAQNDRGVTRAHAPTRFGTKDTYFSSQSTRKPGFDGF